MADDERTPSASLEARIDRLESLDAIRQLPQRYALAVDTRNLDETWSVSSSKTFG